LARGFWCRDRRRVLGRIGGVVLVISWLMLALATGQAENAIWREPMDPDMQEIETLRTQYEARLLGIDGVVSVSVGLGENGRPHLKIGTSQPVDTVRRRLPADLPSTAVELQFLGEIRAQ
jgi:4-amino-4-deoxy-L-arabinose transferase-like glycosyltransferase